MACLGSRAEKGSMGCVVQVHLGILMLAKAVVDVGDEVDWVLAQLKSYHRAGISAASQGALIQRVIAALDSPDWRPNMRSSGLSSSLAGRCNEYTCTGATSSARSEIL